MNSASWYRVEDCDVADLAALADSAFDLDQCPTAAELRLGVPIYSRATLDAAAVAHPEATLLELAQVLTTGPGVFVVEEAIDCAAIDAVSPVFSAIIAEQRAAHGVSGDHYGEPGANDRIWNAAEKLAVRAPEAFADYYASSAIALASRAWLGPGYQVTSQVNVVNPGGAAQSPHRDYHLGFMLPDEAQQFPPHVHHLSGQLTLQGAIAHVDMPLDSGPTLYLPHSQKYSHGFLAWGLDAFKEHFEQHHIQLPLKKGDAIFFNPALFHAAGHNCTNDTYRMANLLQVSSAFGRAIEKVDRKAMTKALYPILQTWAETDVAPERIEAVICASAEGYSFPTDLDQHQPVDGLSAPSQAALVREALHAKLPLDQLMATLD